MNMEVKFRSGMRNKIPWRSFFYFTILAFLAFVFISTISLFLYQTSPLHNKNNYKENNIFWRDSLGIEHIDNSYGPHEWDEDCILFIDDEKQIIKKCIDESSFFYGKAPESISHPILFFNHKDGFVAGKDSVWHRRDDDDWVMVIEDFRAWHTGISATDDNRYLIGEYGDRLVIYSPDKMLAEIVLHKPDNTNHFHVANVDPYTGDMYASLGDSHRSDITGIKKSTDYGESWEWIHYSRRGMENHHRQPTAILFSKYNIYFGTDSEPHGVFLWSRSEGDFNQAFVMPKILKSWFTDFAESKGVLWGVSRSFSQEPEFGVLWASVDGESWAPVHLFENLPYWLEVSDSGYISVGFMGNASIVYFNNPGSVEMSRLIDESPGISPSIQMRAGLYVSRVWIDFHKSLYRRFVR